MARRELVLASASASRRRLLEAAGVAFRVVPADVDEAALKRTLSSENASAAEIAAALARAKAVTVSTGIADAIVIGADQVLAFGEELFDKPTDLGSARTQLLRLRGNSHQLWSAVALAVGGKRLWRCEQSATLTMRSFTPAFLDRYLDAAGEAVTRSVGAYEIEGSGIQLFERVEGDYFTILGLPLVALLEELRTRGVIEA